MAGLVCAHTFIDKNKNEIPLSIANFIKNCNSDIKYLFDQAKPVNVKLSENANSYLSLSFKNSINDLMYQLFHTQCHFIRCIKPNTLLKPNIFQELLVLKQIQYMGLIDSLKIRRDNFSYRSKYIDFLLQYKDLFLMNGYDVGALEKYTN